MGNWKKLRSYIPGKHWICFPREIASLIHCYMTGLILTRRYIVFWDVFGYVRHNKTQTSLLSYRSWLKSRTSLLSYRSWLNSRTLSYRSWLNSRTSLLSYRSWLKSRTSLLSYRSWLKSRTSLLSYRSWLKSRNFRYCIYKIILHI